MWKSSPPIFFFCLTLPLHPDINIKDQSTVKKLTWLNCDSSLVIEHLIVNGGGHDWFGAWGNMDINSTEEIWRFFSKFDINGRISN